jgi:hypothetical protein
MKKKTTTTIPKLTAKAQKVFNAYIRQRDSEGGYFTCISCGEDKPVEQMNAGHFVPVKNSNFLRFHEWNVNGECIRCNCFDEFHVNRYRKNLIDKIGLDAVEWLEENERKVHKMTRTDLETIIITYGKIQP